MDERHSHGPFADHGGEALHRSMTDVAGREQTGPVGIEMVRNPIERPSLWGPTAAHEIGTGDEIAGLVTKNPGIGSPGRLRRSADTDEEPACRDRPAGCR